MRRTRTALALLAVIGVLSAAGCTTKNLVTAPSDVAPRLVVSPDTLLISDSGPTRSIYLTTDAPGTLTWRITSRPGWIAAQPESGTVTQSLQAITVHGLGAGLAPGTYSGRLSILSTGGTAGVDLLFSVREHPSAAVSTVALDFPAGTSQRLLRVRNQGTGILAWTATADRAWISADPAGGDLRAGDSATVAVSVSRTGLPVGVSTGTLTIGGNSEGGPIAIPVGVAVPAGPILTVSPDSLRFDYFVNNRSFEIRNDGNGPLDWTADASQAWLQMSATSGQLAPGASVHVTATVNRTGLASGAYGAHIDVGMSGGTGATIGVVLLHYVQTMWGLDHGVVDAVFDRAHNRIITVSASPNRLNVLDPEGRTQLSVPLSLSPTCVSLRPDGLFAAVGHSGYVTYVDLTAMAVERVYAVTCDALEVVLASNGWLYVFPSRGQQTYIRSIELSTGNESLTGGSIYAGMVGRLHPSGTSLYTVDSGPYPFQMYKFDVSGGPVALLYPSPYWGDYPFGGNLWFSDDGRRIFARSGYVFRSSTEQTQDMTYNGQLAGASSIRWVDHSSAANRVFTVSGEGEADPNGPLPPEVRVYDGTYLGLLGTMGLPSFLVPNGQGGGTLYPGYGNFVFTNTAGTRLYVLTRAKSGSGLPNDWAMAAIDMSGLP